VSYELNFACVQFIQNGRIKTIQTVITVSQRAEEKWEETIEMGGSSGRLFMRVGSKGIEAKTKQRRRTEM